jgi:hypothetical protein
MMKNRISVILTMLMFASLLFAAIQSSTAATVVNYGDITLTINGGIDSGNFADIWDLTAGDISLSFTYDASGVVDILDWEEHAFAELGVRTAQPPYTNFNPYWSGCVCEEESFDLFADQDILIGEVVVQRVGDLLYVTYVINEEGWFITKTHLAVGDVLDDIPQTKKGNPIPGQFDYVVCHDPMVTEYTYPPIDVSGFTNPLYVAAHADVVQLIGDGCCTPQWASSVEEYVQGTLQNGNPVTATSRIDPSKALGAPNGPAEGSFYSLGFTSDTNDDGFVVLSFDYPVYNGPCADLVFVEITRVKSNVPPYYEKADVYVIVDDEAYLAGSVDNYDPSSQLTYNYISIPGEFEYIDAVMLQDTTEKSVFSAFPTGDGYDLDAAGACYLLINKETAWGGTNDFDGKNWATYIVYDPDCEYVEGSGVWLSTSHDEWQSGVI